ncbi:cobalamin trafficking protein CblD-like [Stomoxys calcitrans]|uniref:Methylmalonic aciduria and homocystinuria type D homolog, mitochondrial n=1 Tax=Stomoxys calcitrans TaxID=35570 RepID=A0A1I8Q2D5_STOCA|nr:cobalamin trafficking protein CblD-like [Stomoxys calcitrans]
MSYTLLRWIARSTGTTNNKTSSGLCLLVVHSCKNICCAQYSRRSDSKNLDSAFKVVKSKVRVEDFLGGECGPNWELLAPRGNRFYFPNAVGPAWQGASSTISLDAPLESLVDFEGKCAEEMSMLEFTVNECPSLIKKSLHELFPAPEVASSEKLALLTLTFTGDSEQGASKFVLAAREITSRLRLHGYWADFMNPFSGKPFYSWASGKNLYKVDKRFRGLNMKLDKHNDCVVITSEDNAEQIFSGSIYTNAPSDYLELKTLLDNQV